MSRIPITFSMVALLAAAACVPVAAEQCATLDSLTGTAELQPAGSQEWLLVRTGARLKDNDLLRVLSKSHARLTTSDGSVFYVRENSQMRLNLYKSAESNTISKHAAVFWGAVFFVIKKTLPREVTKAWDPDKQYDTKVFSPTAVVAVRGTSFSIEVDKKDGTSTTKVFNGAVMVTHVGKKKSLYLGSPYKTTVTTESDTLLPESILTQDVDSLRAWVPGYVVAREMEGQLAAARRNRQVIAGKFEDRMIVVPFVNRSTYTGPWDVGAGLANLVAEALKKDAIRSLTIAIGGKAGDDPVAAAAGNRARFVLSGTVESFEIAQFAKVSARADEYSEQAVARVRLTVKLLDMADKKPVYEGVVSGEVSGKNDEANSWATIGKAEFSLQDPNFSASIVGGAVQQTVEQVAGAVGKNLGY